MKVTYTKYVVRNTEDKEPLMRFGKESEAVNFAGAINRHYNREAVEIVKVVTTEVMTVL